MEESNHPATVDEFAIKYNDKGIVELTEIQKFKIVNFWNESPPEDLSIDKMQSLVFGKVFDAREKPALAIKKYLSTKNLKAPAKPLPRSIVLDDKQKEYIVNNYNGKNALEISKDIFHNRNLTATHPESKLVFEFVAQTDKKRFTLLTSETSIDGMEDKEYFPPKHLYQAAARVNRYVSGANIANEEWKKNSRIKSYLDSLINFCHNQRFVHKASRYMRTVERNVFEGQFISLVWDKVDLTPEEISLYVDICEDFIAEMRLDDELDYYEDQLKTSSSGDNEGKKLSMSISEHLGNLRDEKGKNKERRKKLIETLQGKRSERIDKRRKENASILNLVEAWKFEEKRLQLILLAEKRKESIKEEINNLSNMDDVKALLAGISVDKMYN